MGQNTEKFIEIQNFLHLFKGKVMYQGIFLIYTITFHYTSMTAKLVIASN